jgi:hypothetical protein
VSDNFLRIFPDPPGKIPGRKAQGQAVRLLREWLPAAEAVSARVADRVTFLFDSNGPAYHARCGACGKDLTRWFADRLRAAIGEYDAFEFDDLVVRFPCCGSQLSLETLTFDVPAGWARFWLEAFNPPILPQDLPPAVRQAIENALGCPVQMIIVRD